MKQVWLCATLLLVANTACAASFDCSKATTRVEKMICGDAALSKLDGELGKAYAKALTKTFDPSSLKKQQRHWLNERNGCEDTNCLRGKYQKRIAALPRSQTFFTTISPPDVSEFDVNCKKTVFLAEKLICKQQGTSLWQGWIADLDKHMRMELQWALMRSKKPERLLASQRQWQKQVRDVCTDKKRLVDIYAQRRVHLMALASPPGECYTLTPILDADGKLEPIDPVCQAMEKNLNHFCNQPPMVCKLKVAPEFRKQITFPKWTKLDPEANRKLIEKFIRAPWQSPTNKNKYDEDAWKIEKPKVQSALAAKRLTFSKAKLDLYNLGTAQTAYRLDYGTCHIDNPHLKDSDTWDKPLRLSPVQILYAPDIERNINKQYFVMMKSPLHDVLLYENKVYDYFMFADYDRSGDIESSFDVNNHERKIFEGDKRTTVLMNNICRFNYHSVQGRTK